MTTQKSVFWASVAALALGACKSDKAEPSAPPASPTASSPPAKEATPAASAERAVLDSIAIPSGNVALGTTCGEQPRMPSEEASGVSVVLGAFTIDTYPYPGDPAKPPLTGVTHAEARALCEGRGRRLCTELEWERACKGPSNTKYEYGDKYDGKACPSAVGAPAASGSAPACKSAFGVYAMHGFVSEWTSSVWNRPSDTADAAEPVSVVLRGGTGNSPYAHNRCSASKKADPMAKSKAVGFRCCGGTENAADYPIANDTAPLGLEAVTSPPDKLITRVRNALRNGGIKDATNAGNTIASLYRWRPVPNEELYVAKYTEGKNVQPVVVLLCEQTAQLLGRIKAPVNETGDPKLDGTDPLKLTVETARGDDKGTVRFDYRFGALTVAAPPWLSKGK